MDWSAPGAPLVQPRVFTNEDCDLVCGLDGEWLVKGLWPLTGLCFLAGPSMAGKSFLTLFLVSLLAKGEFVLNRRARRSGVVYIASEAANGMRTRVEGLRSTVGGWSGHLRLIPEAPNLKDGDDVARLSAHLNLVKAEMAAKGIRLGAIVIDTLSASIPGADENSAADMSSILRALQDLAGTLEACVIVVAHYGKDAERGIRGWSGQVANADGVIRIEAPLDCGTRIATIVKVKDGEAGEKFAFGLEPLVLRQDADGDDVTTCVVEMRDLPPSKKAAGRPPTSGMTMVLSALKQLSADGAGVPSAGLDRPRIPIKALRDRAYSSALHGIQPTSEDDVRHWRDRRRKEFDNSLQRLQRDGCVGREADLVWLTEPPPATTV